MEFGNHRGFKLSVYYARGYWYVSMAKFTSEQHPYNATFPRTTAVLQNSVIQRQVVVHSNFYFSRWKPAQAFSDEVIQGVVMVPQTESSVLKSGQRIILEM